MSPTGISGTQSPAMQDCEPMGASSIRGGNAGGVPDSQQRARSYHCFVAISVHAGHDVI